MADGISGYVDLGYSESDFDSEDALGNVSRTETSSFTQRYNLSLSRTLYPYLRLSASGLFEKEISTSTSNDAEETDTTLTRILPFVDLTLKTPIYFASARYSRREDKAESSGVSPITLVNEVITGILGWRPEGFPHIEARAERTNNFDKERIFRDTVRDFIGLTMEYEPTDNLMIRYRPTYTDTKNRLTSLETKDTIHNGRVDYSGRFLQDRISFSTSYNIVHSIQETSVSGTGLVSIGVIPFAGLSSIDDTPAEGTLDQNAALIDDNLTESAGINIGLPPITGDKRNIGLDFALAQEVNTLFVWVDRDLPAQIAGSFSWQIYTSSDNLAWNFHSTVFPALFGTFYSRFEISFSSVTARYIKVVVKPLSPSVSGSAVFVTELQAFVTKPAAEVRGKRTGTNHLFNFDGKALLLDNPNLYYEFSYFYTRTDPSSQQRWDLTNALNVSHRFSKVFSGSARAAREDFSDPTGDGVAYTVNTSLQAVPLKTLRHSLTYSGRFEEKDGRSNNTNAFFLFNNAQLYKGVDVTVSGGISFENKETGENVTNTIYDILTSLQPHNTLNMSIFYSSTESDRSGGGKPDSTTFTRRTEASVSYNPFRTLYLVAGISNISDEERNRTFQNYALNFSPFPDGALQFSFTYNESLGSERNEKVRVITPSLRWNISGASYLLLTYQVTKSETDVDRSDAKTFSTNLRVYF